MPKLSVPTMNLDPNTHTFKGSCHCKQVEFEFQHPTLETTIVNSCNCSICTQRGYLFIYITDLDKNFKFTKGSWEDLREYRFGPKRMEHWFCPVCGSGVLEKYLMEVMGINVRCVEGVDVDALKLNKEDGRG